MSDHFRTIAAPVEYRQKIERSEFLGIAFPVTTEEGFFEELTRVQKRYFDATHHCWAFRLRTDGRTRSADAGEPSGTAGRPILSAIEGAELHDAGVIVVRWYGGVKLGTGGLSRAYRDTAAETLRLAQPSDRYLYVPVTITVPYDALGTVYRFPDPPHILLAEENFGETTEFVFHVRASRVEEFTRLLTEKRLEGRMKAEG